MKIIFTTAMRRTALLLAVLFTPLLTQATIVGPYTADANTLILLHFEDTPGGSVAAIASGSVCAGTNFYSVNDTAGSTTPPTVTSIVGGAAGFTGFGNAASFGGTPGYMIGFDGNNNSAFNAESSSTRSPDAIALKALNIGNGAATPFTIEAMVNTPTIGGTTNQEIVCTDSGNPNSANAYRGFQFRINTSGQLEFNEIGGATGTPDAKFAIPTSGANAFVANAWFHVAVAYDGTNLRLYWTALSANPASANLIGTSPAGIGSAVGSSTNELVIGNSGRTAVNQTFGGSVATAGQGLIDEVRISKVARAANAMLFANGVTITVPPTTQVVSPGGTATFSVTATTDFPTLSYQWQTNGVAITNGGDFSGATTAALQVANASSTYAAWTYTCAITNSRPSPGPDSAATTGVSLILHTPLNLSWLASPADYNWNGTSIDWLNTANSSNVAFTIGDNVTFDDGGGNTSPVSLNGTLSPSSLVFNNSSKTYAIVSASGGGNISGGTGLTQSGAGTVSLLSPTNNYTGVTTLNNGVLSVTNLAIGGSASPIGAAGNAPANLVFNGGTLQYGGPNVSIDRGATLGASGGTVTVTNPAATLTLSGVIVGTGGGGLTKAGNGTLALSGANTYNGPTTISAGTVQLTGSGTFSGGNVTNNSAILSSGNITITNNIAGSGTITNDATGTLTLSGTNTYTGATLINGPNDGGLVVASSSALGSSPVTLISTTGGAIGGTRLTLNAGVSTPAGISLLLPTASTTVRSTLFAAGASSWNGPITITGDGGANQLAFAGQGGFLTIGGNVGQSGFTGGTLQLRGDGSANGGVGGAVNGTISISTSTLQINDNVTWTINSTGNTWGLSQIAHGTLQIGANNALPTGTTVQFGAAGNGVLDLNGFNQQVAALTVSGSTDFITNSSAAASSTLIFSGGSSAFGSPLADNFANGGGKLALNVAGGALTLSGVNTYNGNTTLSAGTLALSGSGSIGDSANILVANGAIFDVSAVSGYTLGNAQKLTGSGVVTGAVTVASGALLAAGTGGIGTLSFSNSLTLNATSTNTFAVTTQIIAGAPVNVSSNNVVVAGLLTPNSSVVSVTSGTPLYPGTNTLFTYGSVSGSFNATPVFDVAPVHPASIVDNGAGQINLVVPNQPPVANANSYTRNGLNSWKLGIANLLTNATDPDGDTLTLVGVGVSTNGITLVITNGYVEYYNPNLVDDQFSYTVTDGYGGTNSAVITLTAGSSNGLGGQVSSVAFMGGTASMTFAGIPGYTYNVQVSTNLTAWNTIWTTNAPAGGVFQFNDNSAPLPDAYYRLMWNGN